MLRLTVARQVDRAQAILLTCLSGEVITTHLLAAMHQVFQVIQVHQVQLQLMLVIQTVQQCMLNPVLMEAQAGVQIAEGAALLEPLVGLPPVHHI